MNILEIVVGTVVVWITLKSLIWLCSPNNTCGKSEAPLLLCVDVVDRHGTKHTLVATGASEKFAIRTARQTLDGYWLIELVGPFAALPGQAKVIEITAEDYQALARNPGWRIVPGPLVLPERTQLDAFALMKQRRKFEDGKN